MVTLHVPRRIRFIAEPHSMMLQASVVCPVHRVKIVYARMERSVSNTHHAQMMCQLDSLVLNQRQVPFWPWE